METHLTYDNKGRQLGILFRERLTTDQNLQLKVGVHRGPLLGTDLNLRYSPQCKHQAHVGCMLHRSWAC